MLRRWTASYRRFLLLYVAFWLALGSAYEALFLLTPNINIYAAFYTGLQIIGTAALLGLGVVAVAARTPLPQDNLHASVAVHIVGAFVYSGLWVGALMAIRNIDIYLSTDPFQFVTPPGFVVRWHLIAGTAVYATLASGVISFRSVARIEAQRQAANLRALRAQLNPHFLFNTLHTISMLFRSEPAKAEAAMETFSELMRYALHGDRLALKTEEEQSLVTVGDEWGIVEKYLELERLRLEDRLRVDATIDLSAHNCLIPPLTLQPLVENAVQHAASVCEMGADIRIAVDQTEGILSIRVENNGIQAPGMEPERTDAGIGLQALTARLKAVFGERSKLQVNTDTAETFVVQINVPAIWSLP